MIKRYHPWEDMLNDRKIVMREDEEGDYYRRSDVEPLLHELYRLRVEVESESREMLIRERDALNRENERLKSKLAVFETGIPHKNVIADVIDEWSNYCADSHAEDVPHFEIVADWLRRIAKVEK